MRKGMVLYVTVGKEDVPMQDFPELCRTARVPGIAEAYVATTENDLSYGWCRLVQRGMHQVLCNMAVYGNDSHRFKLVGEPFRLCG